MIEAKQAILNRIAGLRIVNDTNFSNLRPSNVIDKQSPVDFALDILNYLGNNVLLKNKFNDFFKNTLNNIDDVIKKELNVLFTQTFLCNTNDTLFNSFLVPISNIDLLNVYNLDQIKFYEIYAGDEFFLKTYLSITSFQSTQWNDIDFNFFTNNIIGSTNYPNVLQVSLNENLKKQDLLNKFLENDSILKPKNIWRNLININYQKNTVREKQLLQYIDNIAKSTYDYIDNSYYLLIKDDVQYKNENFINYQNGAEDIAPSYYDDNLLDANLLNNDNILDVFIQSIESNNGSFIHLIKQLFSSLKNAIIMEVLNPKMLLMFYIMKNDNTPSLNIENFFTENRVFLKNMIFNVIEKTLFNILYEVIKTDIQRLIIADISAAQREKIDNYILQYKSLLNIN